MKNNQKQPKEKLLKENSYENSVSSEGTKHLDYVPQPHGFGERITQDSE
ncbi:hypothetical protein [Peribacillus saganii]|nr:hypothetical protein [Peribacillus saganii]